MDEVFKPIQGYEGVYSVSNFVRVMRISRNAIIAQRKSRDGYLRVNLSKGNVKKTLSVHRLVAIAFVSNPENKRTVNHINEDKTDNRACNLEWMTSKENDNHGTRNLRMGAKKSKPVFCVELRMRFDSVRKAAKFIGISDATLSSSLTGKCKTAGGYHWKYEKEETA